MNGGVSDMARFEVYRNTGSHAQDVPYLLDVQSDVLYALTAIKLAVIPAWMPESSVQGRQAEVLGTSRDSPRFPGKSDLPSLALDSGIHAGMTPFLNLMAVTVRPGNPRGRAVASTRPLSRRAAP